MHTTTTISLDAAAAASTIANHIEAPTRDADGPTPPLYVTISEPVAATARLRAGAHFTEIRFFDDEVNEQGCQPSIGANVTIERPDEARYGGTGIEPSNVSWSSSSTDVNVNDALVTAKVLAVAAEVAAILDRWAANGELSRLEQQS